MVHLYNEMGLAPEVSVEIVDILSKNKEGFLKIMMIEELQLIAGGENPITNSIVTFFSFAIFGITPIIPSMVAKGIGMATIEDSIVIATILVSTFFLGVLGLAKSCVGGMKWYVSVPETIIIGAIAAGAAFGIGKAF
jgi:VIT1/CCC1 family predicted Fe2+/Mn2+ transporter